MQVAKKVESKVLGRSYVEVSMEGRAGKLTRREAIEAVAKELGVPAENVGLLRIEGQSGTTDLVCKFYVYSSPEAKKRLHLRHLDERTLTKEEREKLKRERKKPKAAAQAQPAEAKK